jgi:hypothetical protein
MSDDMHEHRLRAELKTARIAYKRAIGEFDKAASLANELGMNTSDGAHTMHVASQAYNYALTKYTTAVERFANFILNGVVPADESSESVDGA